MINLRGASGDVFIEHAIYGAAYQDGVFLVTQDQC